MGSAVGGIRGLEDRSLDYLKYFTVLWSALIFFIVREYKQHEVVGDALENLWGSFNPEVLISVDSLTVFLFAVLVSFTVFCLGAFIWMSFPKYSAEGSSEGSLKEKESRLRAALCVAIVLTPMYLLYLGYLLLLSNGQFRHFMGQFLGILFAFYWAVNMFFTPLRIISERKKFTLLKTVCAGVVLSSTMLLTLATVVFVIFGMIFGYPPADSKFIFWLSLPIGGLFAIALIISPFLLYDTKDCLLSCARRLWGFIDPVWKARMRAAQCAPRKAARRSHAAKSGTSQKSRRHKN